MEPFLDVFRALDGISWEHVQPPQAREHFRGDRAGLWDAIVCYDMQGIEFRKPDPPRFEMPPPDYASGIVAMLEPGQGGAVLPPATSASPARPPSPPLDGRPPAS